MQAQDKHALYRAAKNGIFKSFAATKSLLSAIVAPVSSSFEFINYMRPRLDPSLLKLFKKHGCTMGSWSWTFHNMTLKDMNNASSPPFHPALKLTLLDAVFICSEFNNNISLGNLMKDLRKIGAKTNPHININNDQDSRFLSSIDQYSKIPIYWQYLVEDADKEGLASFFTLSNDYRQRAFDKAEMFETDSKILLDQLGSLQYNTKYNAILLEKEKFTTIDAMINSDKMMATLLRMNKIVIESNTSQSVIERIISLIVKMGLGNIQITYAQDLNPDTIILINKTIKQVEEIKLAVAAAALAEQVVSLTQSEEEASAALSPQTPELSKSEEDDENLMRSRIDNISPIPDRNVDQASSQESLHELFTKAPSITSNSKQLEIKDEVEIAEVLEEVAPSAASGLKEFEAIMPAAAETKALEAKPEVKTELYSAAATSDSYKVDPSDYALNLAIALSRSEHEARQQEEIEVLDVYESLRVINI